jgi:hypothetical protein
MSPETRLYFAKKFFGHLLPRFGVACVDAVLVARFPCSVVQGSAAEMDTVWALDAALPGIPVADGKLPADIQWMPPGRHTITPLVNGERKTITVNVDAAAASRVAAELQRLRSASAAGTEDLPFIDFDHRDGEAAAHITELFWAGSDPKHGGIRARLEWTEAGKAAVIGKTFRRFSPTFGVSPSGEIVAAGVNFGGLVNRAAFKTISSIWSRNGGGRSHQPHNNQHQKMKTIEEQLADLSAAVTKMPETIATAVATAMAKANGTQQQQQQQQPGSDPKVLQLETRLASIEASNKSNAEVQAKADVAAAVKAGKIPAQNKELIAHWEKALVVDVNAKAMLDAIPANPTLARIVANGGATTTTTTDEHEFLVKAKAYGEKNKIADETEAQVAFGGTPEGRELYADYRKTVTVEK